MQILLSREEYYRRFYADCWEYHRKILDGELTSGSILCEFNRLKKLYHTPFCEDILSQIAFLGATDHGRERIRGK